MLADWYMASYPLAFTVAKVAANVDDGHGAGGASLILANVYHLERQTIGVAKDAQSDGYQLKAISSRIAEGSTFGRSSSPVSL
jgi:hypothetical protein